jgi:hypothetical protein
LNVAQIVIDVIQCEVRASVYDNAGGLDPDKRVEISFNEFLYISNGVPKFNL